VFTPLPRRFSFATRFLATGMTHQLATTGEGYRFENDQIKHESGTNTGLQPRQIPVDDSPSSPRPTPAYHLKTGKLWSVGLWAEGDMICELVDIAPESQD